MLIWLDNLHPGVEKTGFVNILHSTLSQNLCFPQLSKIVSHPIEVLSRKTEKCKLLFTLNDSFEGLCSTIQKLYIILLLACLPSATDCSSYSATHSSENN